MTTKKTEGLKKTIKKASIMTTKKTEGVKKTTMEETIKQLVELAKGYVSYAKKSIIRMDDYISFRGEHIYARIAFVNDVWFVNMGNIEITTNGHKVTFPYNYTVNDLVKTCTLYTSYLDKLNTDLSNKSKKEVEAERRAEIERLKSKLAELESGEVERLKSKLAELESGEVETESCIF